MTHNEMITYIRAMDADGFTADSDTVLSAFLTQASEAVLNRLYPYSRTEESVLPAKYHITACNIAVYLLNKRGAEGETTHNENGVSRTYGSAYIPSGLLKGVVPHVGTITQVTADENT